MQYFVRFPSPAARFSRLGAQHTAAASVLPSSSRSSRAGPLHGACRSTPTARLPYNLVHFGGPSSHLGNTKYASVPKSHFWKLRTYGYAHLRMMRTLRGVCSKRCGISRVID